MAKLNGIIPSQNFELIRDRVGEILADEFANQVTLADPDDADTIDVDVFIERVIAIDTTEMPVINVSLVRGDYDGKDATQSNGTYMYNIDCYAAAKTIDDPDNPGELIRADFLSSVALQRILGMCRAILDNPQYRTLGYAVPFNCSVTVKSVAVFDPGNNQDAEANIVGRLELSVKVPETTELITPTLIANYATTVKLYLTDKGYHFGPQNDPGGFMQEDGDPFLNENNIDTLIPENP